VPSWDAAIVGGRSAAWCEDCVEDMGGAARDDAEGILSITMLQGSDGSDHQDKVRALKRAGRKLRARLRGGGSKTNISVMLSLSLYSIMDTILINIRASTTQLDLDLLPCQQMPSPIFEAQMVSPVLGNER